ncbi:MULTISPECIES: FxsB family cyclophane-forming radical SAM/SPASM peptide maturase [unclassified Parafrankia]|uniref:FxsB family cyclophane-forming radical SAM/SPASM peptide maturase n=1 Tax=unclassified Parafrankia TaxID=2994368 RepID=UPI000DA472EF|nr:MULTISPECIES: FxsB family cyclophane-forming radical SAM/SPASM peptide maturase [unclassified Parafrankia]TCJ34222.1 FxsB family radical SAM/SPASM domain protein [Parafrankia sp. BMG5.11]SQE00747.1 Radical SAM domain protein [Parafrankia sp. Ea1.12]
MIDLLDTTYGDRAAEWPANELDFHRLSATGWRPTPFRQIVFKINSRCNLSCTYCYVYHQADQSWRGQPVTMSPAVVEVTARRLSAHARKHELPRMQIILHGGEPLLAGPGYLRNVVERLLAAVGADTTLEFALQTNGTLIDEVFLELCREFGIQVGVSVDGDPAVNDRRRTRRNGTGSHAEVARGLRLLTSERFRPIFAGLLCVVDPVSDPREVYESLLAWRPPNVDFLLPHGNWTARPPARGGDETSTPYADWLGDVFDRWYPAPEHETDVRVFLEIIALILGGHSHIETVGLSPSSVVVIETDGSIEQVDALKSAYHGAASTGLAVQRNDLDEALRHPGIVARQIGLAALGPECARCPVRRVCGGGYYPHRYQAGSGFRNRSVYCPDLFALITKIGRQIRADVEKAKAQGEH